MNDTDRERDLIARLERIYEAFNRKDADALLEMVDEHFVLHRIGGFPEVTGAEAFRAWLEPDALEEQTAEPLEFRVNGDKVFVRQHNRGRGRGSGIELDVESYAVWTARDDGTFVRADVFTISERDEALRAAGLEGEA